MKVFLQKYFRNNKQKFSYKIMRNIEFKEICETVYGTNV
jgi:hypothetical protein